MVRYDELHQVKICIVNDVYENGDVIQRVLGAHETSVFTDPAAALQPNSSNPVDLLIADQKMPSMTGLELMRRVHELKKEIVAIIVSVYTEADDLVAAVNSNTVYRYLVKPFSLEELRNAVATEQARLQQEQAQRRFPEQLAIQNWLLVEENDSLRGDPADSGSIRVRRSGHGKN